MPTLTNLATLATATVTDVIGYESARPATTREHEVIGSGVPDFTIKPARPRRGRFELLTVTRAAGVALETFLSAPGPFRLTATTMPDATFLVTGDVRLRYDGSTHATVSVDWTSVS